MKTLKDILEVPLIDLEKGMKDWITHSCQFWNDWLNDYSVSAAMKAGNKEEEVENKDPEPEPTKIPDDLAAVIEYNKAIVEKYQTTESESLLKHLVSKLAKERGIKDLDKKGEALLEELKNVLDVSPEKRELLKMPKADRAESVVKKVISDNPELMTRIFNGDKEVIKEFDKKAIEAACETVDRPDLKFALRAMINVELTKKDKPNA